MTCNESHSLASVALYIYIYNFHRSLDLYLSLSAFLLSCDYGSRSSRTHNDVKSENYRILCAHTRRYLRVWRCLKNVNADTECDVQICINTVTGESYICMYIVHTQIIHYVCVCFRERERVIWCELSAGTANEPTKLILLSNVAVSVSDKFCWLSLWKFNKVRYLTLVCSQAFSVDPNSGTAVCQLQERFHVDWRRYTWE